jgi:hypothetical protein
MSATACWNEYLTCSQSCSDDFSDGSDVEPEAYVEFGITVDYDGSVVLDAQQLREAIAIGLGLFTVTPDDIVIIGIGSGDNRRREATNAVDIMFQIAVNETEGNSTASMLQDALNSGGVQSQLADEVGLDDVSSFNSFGDVTFQASSQTTTAAPYTTTGDDGGTPGGSTSIDTGAIIGIAVGALVVVGLIVFAMVPKGKKVRRKISKRGSHQFSVHMEGIRQSSPVRKFSKNRPDDYKEESLPNKKRLSISQL